MIGMETEWARRKVRIKTDTPSRKNENTIGKQEKSGSEVGQRGRRAGTLEDMLGLEGGALQ